MVKRRGAGTTTLSSDSQGVTFTNTGTVKVMAGTLQLSSGITQSAANAEVQLLGGNLDGSTLTFAGGKITGVESISSSVINSGATLSPDPTDARTIRITGSYTQQSGGRLDLDSDAATGGL